MWETAAAVHLRSNVSSLGAGELKITCSRNEPAQGLVLALPFVNILNSSDSRNYVAQHGASHIRPPCYILLRCNAAAQPRVRSNVYYIKQTHPSPLGLRFMPSPTPQGVTWVCGNVDINFSRLRFGAMPRLGATRSGACCPDLSRLEGQ